MGGVTRLNLYVVFDPCVDLNLVFFFEMLTNKKTYNGTIMGPGPWRRQLGALGPWGPMGPHGAPMRPMGPLWEPMGPYGPHGALPKGPNFTLYPIFPYISPINSRSTALDHLGLAKLHVALPPCHHATLPSMSPCHRRTASDSALSPLVEVDWGPLWAPWGALGPSWAPLGPFEEVGARWK